MDQERKFDWQVLNRKIKKSFLNEMASRHPHSYTELAKFFSLVQPVIIVGIKNKKGFCAICPTSNKLIAPVIENYLNEPNSEIRKIILDTLENSK